MKSKIKVYLQYPWKFPDSPYYKYIIDNPPKGIEYLNKKKREGVITNKNLFWISNFLKRNVRRFITLFRLSIPNSHFSPKENYDLIHCAHCLSKNVDKPWVADFEGAWQMYVGKKTKKSKEKIKNILNSDNCKKIMPWTEKTKKDILEEFPEIEDKVEVVYPAVPLQKLNKKNSKKITILYATRYFWIKGGIVALEVFRKIKEKYDVNLVFISDVPENIKMKYADIEILNLMPQEELFDYYSKADIFFYPSLVDTFGFALLEAMSFGLPVVTINTDQTKTRNEIIKNNENGLIFDVPHQINYYKLTEKEIVNKLVKSLSKLIEDKKLRNKMSKNCIKEISSGKFSLKERNKKLKRIYEEALK